MKAGDLHVNIKAHVPPELRAPQPKPLGPRMQAAARKLADAFTAYATLTERRAYVQRFVYQRTRRRNVDMVHLLDDDAEPPYPWQLHALNIDIDVEVWRIQAGVHFDAMKAQQRIRHAFDGIAERYGIT